VLPGPDGRTLLATTASLGAGAGTALLNRGVKKTDLDAASISATCDRAFVLDKVQNLLDPVGASDSNPARP
jgi:hypothetical protein